VFRVYVCGKINLKQKNTFMSNEQSNSQLTIECNDHIFNDVIHFHCISENAHTDAVNAYNPALDPIDLTQNIKDIINNPNNSCRMFMHFSANPFEKGSNQIWVNTVPVDNNMFIINYSVGLFRKLVTQYDIDPVNPLSFLFNKAIVNSTAFDIIFKVMRNNECIYAGNVSSGFPFIGALLEKQMMQA